MAKPRNQKRNPIQPGISISSKYSTNGTIGLIVYDKRNNNSPCILSNWHVLAKKLKGLASFKAGKPVYQPGRLIGGRRSSNIASRLVRYHKGTDSAIAKIQSRDFIPNIFESNILISSIRARKEGDILEKSGARTGITQGVITKVNGSKVTIKPLPNSPLNIEISMGGDSGSVWYDPLTNEGIVLHNTGDKESSNNDETAWGHALVNVFENLDITL